MTTITKELLLADGWVEGKDPVYFASKKIGEGGDGVLKLLLHGLYNQHTFAVSLPDGGLLNFVANSMEELKAFESAIISYDSPY